jgi:hypothetical protein
MRLYIPYHTTHDIWSDQECQVIWYSYSYSYMLKQESEDYQERDDQQSAWDQGWAF